MPADSASLVDTTILLTGGTSGIGRAAAQRLAGRGATVAIVGRNQDRGVALAGDRSDGGAIRFHQADLADQATVRSLAEEVRSTYDSVDVIAHNAGVSLAERTETPDGIETTFAVNHLAPYLLTHELLDALTPGGRVVVTSSGLHRDGDLDFDDLEYERTEYDALDAYASSKLANVAFTIELADRLDEAGIDATANCFHPGFVPSTGLFRNARLRTRLAIRVADLIPWVGTGPETGARLIDRLATDPEFGERTGCYVGSDGIETPASAATDETVRAQLWTTSADYVGVDPAWP